MRADLRQLRFPEEFRIAPAVWGPEELSALQEALRLQETARVQPEPPGDGGPGEELLRNIATGLWRIRRRMLEPGSDEPVAAMRGAFRHLQATWDVLSEAGIEIQDHTGWAYDPGLSLNVLAHQPTGGIGREEVVETVKPSVYLRGVMIQMGDVVVGVPEKK
jgi:hypothetical protein